ncbi:MAG: hypothetical protein ACTSPI_14925 [Candidatus Heimdallarchaeaceae archaeon]
MAFQWIQYQYPVEQQFEKMILWVDSSCRIYFALKDKDADDWTYFSGNASHGLSSGSTLVNRGSSESSAQTNYWLATPDSNNRVLAILPVPELAKYVRVYIDDANDAPTQIYEFRPSTSFIADEIISGSLTITDEFTSPPVITVSSGGKDRIKIGDLGNTFGIKGYDDSSNVIFELSASTQQIAGFTFTASKITSTGITLDSANKRLGINDDIFGNQGIQLDYNSGTPRFYAGDGSDNYIKYTDSGVDISTNQVDGVKIKYGSDILLEHGGDIKFTSVTAPTACNATLIATTGNVDAGVHSYAVTFVNDAGETELGSASNSVITNATYAQVLLTAIPTSPSESVTSRKIYRTKAGGSLYYYLDTIPDNTATTYTDNIADIDLGEDGTYRRNDSFGKIYVDGRVVINVKTGVFIGDYAGASNTSGFENIGIGSWSLYNNTIGYRNIALGYSSLNNHVGGYDNVAIGGWSLYSSNNGAENVAIGRSALYNNTGNFNIAIGSHAGYYETGSNKLYIANSDTTNPLIYGDFSINLLRCNGEFNINNPSAGDSIQTFQLQGTDKFTIGVDDSDSDKLKINIGSSIADDSLLELDSDGRITIKLNQYPIAETDGLTLKNLNTSSGLSPFIQFRNSHSTWANYAVSICGGIQSLNIYSTTDNWSTTYQVCSFSSCFTKIYSDYLELQQEKTASYGDITCSMKEWVFQDEDMADDGYIDLPDSTGGILFVFAYTTTTNAYEICFTKNDSKISVNSLNVAASDSDGNLCIYGVTGPKIRIKNRLGDTAHIRAVYFYYEIS